MSEMVGLQQFVVRLDRVARVVPEKVARALYEEAQEIRTRSMRLTPVDTGALRASHVVSGPERVGNVTEVVIGVGGPAAPYAVYVHENLDARHPVGQAKFLQDAVLGALPGFARRIAARIEIGRGI